MFEAETKLRATLESEAAAAREKHAAAVALANEDLEKALAAARAAFDKAQLALSQEWNAARQAELDAAVAEANARAGLDKDGNVPKKASRSRAAV